MKLGAFQFGTHRWGRRGFKVRSKGTGFISILAPAWGGVRYPSRRRMRGLFQFSPPRGGRHPEKFPTARDNISILAPAWGASPRPAALVKAEQISILAPAWGASGHMCPRCRISEFQFSPPRGGRHSDIDKITDQQKFQFSPPRGGRPKSPAAKSAEHNFNSRPRVGGVSTPTPCLATPRYFNSRPRVGGVLQNLKFSSFRLISILAPAWGASGGEPRMIDFSQQFQFSPPRGGRQHIYTNASRCLCA